MARYPAAIAFLCLAAAPAQRVDPPPSRIEGPAVGEQVRRDLGTLFQPGGSIDANSGRAEGHLLTRPNVTNVPGVCRRDELIVSYAGPGSYVQGAVASAVRPSGVTANAWFKVMHDPGQPITENVVRSWAEECAALSDAETRGWFVAPDAHAAVAGYRAFAVAARQINQPAHGIAGCQSLQAQQDCRNALASPERIARTGSCPASGNRVCYWLGFNDEGLNQYQGVTIRLHTDRRGQLRVDALDIDWIEIMI